MKKRLTDVKRLDVILTIINCYNLYADKSSV